MRVTSDEETIQAKESYELLTATHGVRVCAYRSDKKNPEPLFKESVNTCGQQISYCGVGYHHQNAIVERIIKEFTLGNRNLLLHSIRLCPESVSTMLWIFLFNTVFQRYNIL